MRRLILNIVCLFPLWLTAAAGTFSLSTVSGHVGDTVTVTASLSDFSGVAALQMTLQLGEHLRYLPGSATLSSSQTSHQVMAGGSNGKLIVNVYNYTGATLIGSSGNLFSFQLVLGNEPASYPLQSEVLLSNASGTGIAVTSSAGSVTLLAPKIQIVTQELNFGHIPIRSTYLQTLTVRNIGNESLHISNTEFSAVEFSAEQTECTIPAGSSQDITINYTPVQHGAVSETLRLRSDAINDANVYGDNLVLLNADPYSVNELHVQPAEGISDDTVTVTLSMNNMETNLVGLQVSFVLPPQLIFVESSTTPLSRASDLTAASSMSNDTLTLYLFSFNNTAITGEEGNLMTFQLRLNGDGWYNLEPLNAVLTNPSGENMVSAVYSNYVKIQSPEMSVWPYPLSFDSVPITSRDTAICNIYNYGQAPLIVSKVTFLQEGFRVVTPLPVTLEQYNSIPLEVEFSPKVDGAVSTIMQIYSNDPNNRMKSVEVTAQVYEPNKLLLSGELQEDNSYLLSVGLENYTPILGVQFDIICPSGLTPQSFVPSERLQGLSLIMQSVGNNTWRVIVYSLTGASVSSPRMAMMS